MHGLAAEGAPAGTVVVAARQAAGRGRQGRPWASEAGAGLWFTLLERPSSPEGVELMALRAGLALAPALDPHAGEMVRLKWPNDLYTSRGKLGGILIEARWRDGRVEWVAIGVGVNLREPPLPGAAALAPGADPLALLEVLLPPLRAGVGRQDRLDAGELASFAARDLAAGKRVRAPEVGVVRGITAGGELVVMGDDGVERRCRSGSLLLEGDA